MAVSPLFGVFMSSFQQKADILVVVDLSPVGQHDSAFSQTDRSQTEILGHQNIVGFDEIGNKKIGRLLGAVHLNDPYPFFRLQPVIIGGHHCDRDAERLGCQDDFLFDRTSIGIHNNCKLF